MTAVLQHYPLKIMCMYEYVCPSPENQGETSWTGLTISNCMPDGPAILLPLSKC